MWLNETCGDGHVLYRADEVDVSNAFEYPSAFFVRSDAVTERIAIFARAGYRWVTFHEAPFEDTSARQYVYLGTDPIRTRCTDPC